MSLQASHVILMCGPSGNPTEPFMKSGPPQIESRVHRGTALGLGLRTLPAPLYFLKKLLTTQCL